MKFETSLAAAQRLQVTVRAIQKWAKEGKIPHAHKVGRDWMIPADAVRPDQVKPPVNGADSQFNIEFTFQPGSFWNYVSSIENDDLRAIALGEYYYLTGELKQSSIVAEPYLNSKDPVLRSTAALFCIFANLSRSHLKKSKFAMDIIGQTLDEALKGNYSMQTKAICALSAVTLEIQLHLPINVSYAPQDYVKHLPTDLQMFALYLMAYNCYMQKDYSKAIGVVETAITISPKRYTLAFIYIYIIAAISYINLQDVQKAQQYIQRAWELAAPDGIYMPFVEHYNLMQGVIENYFKQQHPKDYERILALVKSFNLSWFELHNNISDIKVAQNLTPTEFTVAMLYSRNWRAKQIAAHIGLSERTVMNYIQIIYEKLHISGKKDLEKYILK